MIAITIAQNNTVPKLNNELNENKQAINANIDIGTKDNTNLLNTLFFTACNSLSVIFVFLNSEHANMLNIVPIINATINPNIASIDNSTLAYLIIINKQAI